MSDTPGRVDDLGVDDPYAVLPDRAHAQLGLERHPELTYDDHVQRRAKRLRHLGRDRDAASRQAKDNDGLVPQVPQPHGHPAHTSPPATNCSAAHALP